MKNKKKSAVDTTPASTSAIEQDFKKYFQKLDYLCNTIPKLIEDVAHIKKKMVVEPEFYSIKMASLYLGLEEKEILTYCHKKILHYEQPYDSNYYFKKDALDSFLHDQHYKHLGFEDFKRKNPHHFRVLED